jgi:MFS family permease
MNNLATFYVVFFFISAGLTTFVGALPMTVVGNWFRKRVSLATGILVCGVAFGGLLVPLVTHVIDTFGWRIAMVIFGLVAFMAILPLSFIVRHKPEQYGYLSDGTKNTEVSYRKEQMMTTNHDANVGVGQALKSVPFWIIALCFAFHNLMLNAVTTHIMPYLSSIGITRSASSFVASAIPIMSVLGRLSGGWFGDKFEKRHVLSVCFVLEGLGIFFLYCTNLLGASILIPFLIIYSIGWGGIIPMMPALVREYFGREKLGTILGMVMGIMTLGGASGPPIAGWIFDTYGSYRNAWFVLMGVAIAGIVSTMIIPSITKWQKAITVH